METQHSLFELRKPQNQILAALYKLTLDVLCVQNNVNLVYNWCCIEKKLIKSKHVAFNGSILVSEIVSPNFSTP